MPPESLPQVLPAPVLLLDPHNHSLSFTSLTPASFSPLWASIQLAGGGPNTSWALSGPEQVWGAPASWQQPPCWGQDSHPSAGFSLAWALLCFPPQDSPSSTPTPPARLAWPSSTSRTPSQRMMAPTPVWLRTPRGRCPAAPASLSRVGASGQPSRNTFPANTSALEKGHRIWRQAGGGNGLQELTVSRVCHRRQTCKPSPPPPPHCGWGKMQGKEAKTPLVREASSLIGRKPHPLREDELL